jgi:cytochrome P450
MTDWKDIDAKIMSNAYYAGNEFHDTFRMMRREDPIHWTDGNYGRALWSVTRYDDTAAILTDTDTFSSKFGGNLPPDPEQIFRIDQHAAGFGSLPTFTDAPRHMKLRRPFNKHFATPVIARMTETVQTITNQILDEVEPRGECDFVDDVAAQLPMRLVCDMMGVPEQDWALMRSFAHSFMGSTDPEFRRAGMTESESQLSAQKDLFDYMTALAMEKRKNPTDDFTSLIGTMTMDDELWEARDVGWWCFSMIAGGLETTRNAVATGMLALIQNPDQEALLRSDLSLMNKAVEEILRWATPSKHKLRVATRDIEMRGKLIKKDDWVVPWLISANRDELMFEDPYAFKVDRDPNQHISFGVSTGDHFCLGRNLARLEIKIILETILKRFPAVELAGEYEWLASSNTAGLKHMPVRFRPSPIAEAA